jgi:hypothetical protein
MVLQVALAVVAARLEQVHLRGRELLVKVLLVATVLMAQVQ